MVNYQSELNRPPIFVRILEGGEGCLDALETRVFRAVFSYPFLEASLYLYLLSLDSTMPHRLQVNMNIRDASRRKELFRQATQRAKRSKCFFPNCTNSAIGSHVLQEHGVLDQIAENGHIMELKPRTLFEPSRFNRGGIGSTDRLRFYGFCNTPGVNHDSEIFSEIENRSIDFSSYRTHLLFSYRALCNVLYQANLWGIYYDLVRKDTLISHYGRHGSVQPEIKNIVTIKESEHFKYLMEGELFRGDTNRHFIFYKYEIPRIDLVVSHSFSQSYRPPYTYHQVQALNPYDPSYRPCSIPFFINVVPNDQKSIVIFGHIAGVDIANSAVEGIGFEYLPHLNASDVFQLISDILVRRIDTWALSSSLYDRLVFQDKIDLYLKFISDYHPEDKRRSFFYPNNRGSSIFLPFPYEFAQQLREANRWELWRFSIPFNLFEGIV